MKKFIFTTVTLAILSMGMANAQITPSTQRVSLTGDDRAVLDQRVSRHTAFTIDKKELTDYHPLVRTSTWLLHNSTC